MENVNMRNVNNFEEKQQLKELLNLNRFSLKDALLDAKKLSGDRTNNLGIDNIENIVENEIQQLNVFDVMKDKKDYRRTEYLIELDIMINDEVYRIKNWFVFDRKLNVLEDSSIYYNELEEGII
jgi:hypothetical protein